MLAHHSRDGVFHKGFHTVSDIVAFQNVTAIAIDGLALTIEHVVILQHVLANFCVASFDLALGRLNRPADDTGFDGEVFLITGGARHESFSGTGVEHSHQIIAE